MGATLLLGALATTAAISLLAEEKEELKTVEKVDLQRYMGRWYEIARFPHRFERGCHGTTADYRLNPEGYVEVTNTCQLENGKRRIARGKAFVSDKHSNSKLKVEFFWPFKGDYWITDLAPDYSYAVVAAPDRDYLWILSRHKTLDPHIKIVLLNRLRDTGFDVSRLLWTDQTGTTE